MALNFDTIKTEANGLMIWVQTAVVNGGKRLPLHAAWQLIQTALAKTVLIIEQNVVGAVSGPEKKAAAMAIIGQVVNVVIGSITLPYVPLWIQNMMGNYIKTFLLEVASGSIDALVSTFHDTGVFPSTPPPATDTTTKV